MFSILDAFITHFVIDDLNVTHLTFQAYKDRLIKINKRERNSVVECKLPKLDVGSSNLLARFFYRPVQGRYC